MQIWQSITCIPLILYSVVYFCSIWLGTVVTLKCRRSGVPRHWIDEAIYRRKSSGRTESRKEEKKRNQRKKNRHPCEEKERVPLNPLLTIAFFFFGVKIESLQPKRECFKGRIPRINSVPAQKKSFSKFIFDHFWLFIYSAFIRYVLINSPYD